MEISLLNQTKHAMDHKAQVLELAEKLGLKPELCLNNPVSRPAWVKDSVNGVKFEIEYHAKKWRLIVGYDDETNSTIIRDEFPEAAPRKSAAWFYSETQSGILEIATRVKDFIIAEGLTREGRRVKEKTADEGYFEKTAQIIELAVKLEHWDILERGGLGFDAHDSLITLGKSKAVLDNPEAPVWREHLVPCCMIKDRAVEMFQNGASSVEVAQMLKENLAIVIITQEEQKKVDSLYQTTMPNGWSWGDSIFARLDAFHIAY